MCDTLLGLDPWARESYPLVKLLGTSGMKLSEATNIKWGEIDFERDHLVVSGGEVGSKNRQIRTVPLFPAMLKFLESILTSMKCPEINIYLNLSLPGPLWIRQVVLPDFLASLIIA